MITLESPESSSPIVTRAIAAGLRNEYTENYPFPGWQKSLLSLIGLLPQGVARYAISRFQSISGLPPRVLEDFSLQDLLQTRLADYTSLEGRFPVITMGAALGGATTYLSLALKAPFLPQTFVTTLKGGSTHGDVNEYLHRSLEPALQIARDNPGLMTIQHYDPIHDGWLTRYVNHLRFKLLELPPAYADFIRTRLVPGGTVVFLEGGATWLRYRLGPRSIFQVGGWGGIPAEEFLSGSERIRQYTQKTGLRFSNWSLQGDEWPLETGPESEWGTEPGLAESLSTFCRLNGYRFIRIPLPHPNDFSRLAFRAGLEMLASEQRQPAGVLVEMFSQFDATAARLAGLLPLWLIFNTQDSLDYLKSMSARFPANLPVFFSPLSTFSLTPDMVPFTAWASTLEGFKWTNIGARRSHYPADARAIVEWAQPLRKWVAAHRDPLTSTLQPERLAELAVDVIGS